MPDQPALNTAPASNVRPSPCIVRAFARDESGPLVDAAEQLVSVGSGQRGRTVRCAHAVRKVGYFRPVFLDTAALLRNCCCLAKYGDTLSQCLPYCCKTSYCRPHILRPTFSFSMDLSIGDTVFYTRSNGVQVRARVVETAPEGFVHLEYYHAVTSVNGHSKIESIFFVIPSSDSPPHYSPSFRSRSGGWFSGWSRES